jgi:hypothetical protein
MGLLKDRVKEFFIAYQRRFTEGLAGKPDVEATVAAFADYFVEASPVGFSGGKNDSQFKKVIPKGYEFYRRVGTKRMILEDISINPLNESHYAVTVHWKSDNVKKDGTPVIIKFDVIYLLKDFNDGFKIFGYITGDEQGELQKHGLL